MIAVLSSVPSFDGDAPRYSFPASLQVVGAERVLHALQALIDELLHLGEPFRVGLGNRQQRVPSSPPGVSSALA